MPKLLLITASSPEIRRVRRARFLNFQQITPFPGTPLFRRMEAEGRILTQDWSKYNSRQDVVYQPAGMSVEELLAGFRYANERFYSLQSIARRLSQSPAQLWWTLPLNLAYRYRWWRGA